MDVVYFELNNWFAGMDYPNAEPFLTWCSDNVLQFRNKDFIQENQLCVVETCIDMSVNWCITAPKAFVEKYCPKLLSDETFTKTFLRTSSGETTEVEETYSYSRFLRFPDEDGDVYGRFGTLFKQWSLENVGCEFREEDD